MAFSTAGGYGNLPNGNFSPVIYSKKVQSAFRKTSIVEDITNSDYFGEIANFGDTVRIIKEPEITVKEYTRGATVTGSVPALSPAIRTVSGEPCIADCLKPDK